MDIQRVKNYWLEEAEDALRVMQHLYEAGDYSYALFFGHLAVEKILKAVYVIRKSEHAPYLHDLVKLAKQSDIPLTSVQKKLLTQITDFNIEARYPDEKKRFREKCTEDFTRGMINKIEEIFQWLKSML